MKALAIVALVCGLGSVGAGAYGMIETKPNYDSIKDDLGDRSRAPSMARLDEALYSSYQEALRNETLGAWAAGLFAIVGGAMAAKRGYKGLGVPAIVLGLAGAGLGFAIMPQPF